MSFMLMEQRIMLQSVDRHRLTASAEALQALLFPFSWQHVYIPLLPAKFLPYAQAPVPLMVGVEACFAQHSDIRVAAAAAVVVDLDANQVCWCAAGGRFSQRNCAGQRPRLDGGPCA